MINTPSYDLFTDLNTRYGKNAEKAFCRWHATFVRGHPHMFPWSCADQCVLTKAREIHYQDIQLDENTTLNEAISKIGKDRWQLIKTSPRDVGMLLGKTPDSEDPLASENWNSENQNRKQYATDAEARFLHHLTKTVFCATVDLDYEQDLSQDISDFLENNPTLDSTEMMLIATIFINFLHFQSLKELDREKTMIEERCKLVNQITNNMLKSYDMYKKYKREDHFTGQ